jgi:type IV pilus assembly protein PilQ
MVMFKLKFFKNALILFVLAVAVVGIGISLCELPPSQPISMDFQNADIRTVLRSFSVYAGKNILASPEVEGEVTIFLEDVPWRTALDLVLRANGYGAKEEAGVIRVDLWDQFLEEDIKYGEAQKRREGLLPLETRIIDVSFARANEVVMPLSSFLTSRGVLEVDERTNSIIVSDIAERVDQIVAMIAQLDSETPQVEINAKLVDVDARVLRDLGINWTVENGKIKGVDGSINAEVDATGSISESSAEQTISNPTADLSVGILGPYGEFNATISALESENMANIISNPTITTLNNREALIIVGKKIPLIVQDEAGNPITQLTTVGIQMRVKPQVNSQTGEITMDLHPEVSDLSSQATVQGGIIIVTSEADTRVMVQDGQTAVIGGLIRHNEGYYETGVPVLRDIPMLGKFFGSTSKVDDKRELVIFVTPRVVDL